MFGTPLTGESRAMKVELQKELVAAVWARATEGRPELGSNRDAIGATLVLTTSSGNRVWRTVQGSTGYLSAHPKRQYFGLGQDAPDELTIRWPDGSTQVLSDLEQNQHHEIAQAPR